MRVAVPRETTPGERRVALVPEIVGRLVSAGIDVTVEAGAGEAAFFQDADYAAAGASIAAAADLFTDAGVVAKVQGPREEELALLPDGAVLIGFLQPLTDPEGISRLSEHRVTAFALESIPRITRAQAMDALSSQSTVAGYKAVLIAADRLPRFFPLLMTAAGTVAPAKVLILGAGVAGLQAIATARRLGAVVSAFDTRPVVKEQVESLGARFVELDLQGEETAGGYAAELSEEQHRLEQELIARHVADSDVVITTALVPGRPAPLLVPRSSVEAMRPGSVIVDLAAEAGGNCELTEAGREVEHEGVTVAGPLNLASAMPYHASQLLARNVYALLTHLIQDGELQLDFEDEITAGACVSRPRVAA